MQSKSVESIFKIYKENLIEGLLSINIEELQNFVGGIEKKAKAGASLYIIGNGGSAATASHFANDLFSLSVKIDEFNLKAESLTDNASIITALGNDLSFDDIFIKQLERRATFGDALLVLSASGNSENLVRAAQWAKEKRLLIFSITGFDGGRIHALSDYPIHIPSEEGEYEKSEDLHLFVNHFFRYYIQEKWS